MLFKIQGLGWGIPFKDSNTAAACIYHLMDGEELPLSVNSDAAK
ncbi:hypothetical protein A2U01_0081255, partial [Trifolium medium]|nr:hypothetical protein [Trifolium medium]